MSADLVGRVAREPRTYTDLLDAWRTSCPRLAVWEDALDRGFLSRDSIAGQGSVVTITEAGRTFLLARNASAYL